ncbi:TIM-barrel domain-containing protein [Gracilibacillus sp. YIM 98692]|uniref:glycoside hydrolase family 31 protein n=1 Tax=Gracilibacillus sp. YIM 98692 TaxID=2663532 RepID=UPI0013D09D25|nr:TIM-barrel domain-containing protein [Gracilibacillus sp. YIM 98692]
MKREQSFSSLLNIYLLQLKQDSSEEINSLLLDLQPNIDKDHFYHIATWLWLYQRERNYGSLNNELKNIHLETYINYMESNWDKKHENVLSFQDEDIYLSNLSIAYAALLESKNTGEYAYVQKNMTNIRDYVFEHLLHGGLVLNGNQTRKVSVDQSLSVLPFGLFSPEDLVMVEAMKRMTLELKREAGFVSYAGLTESSAEATIMMALYHLEKAEQRTAHKYYEQALALKQNQFSNILIQIYEQYQRLDESDEQLFIHEPLGNENVYQRKPTERVPHYPSLDDPIKLVCETNLEQIQSVNIHIKKHSDDWELTYQMKKDKSLYKCWLPPLPHHGAYDYYFSAETMNGGVKYSPKYTLKTVKKYIIDSFYVVDRLDHKLICEAMQAHHAFRFEIKCNESGVTIQLPHKITKAANNEAKYDKDKLTCHSHSVEVDGEKGLVKIVKENNRILESHQLQPFIEYVLDTENEMKDVKINWDSSTSEAFFGFGERYNAMNQRGNVIDCYVYNQYRDQQTKTYMPIPFYLTNQHYGCFIDTNAYTSFDLGAELHDKHTMFIDFTNVYHDTNIHLFIGDFKEQIEKYMFITGKPAMIPAWALGPWMSSNNWDRQSIVEKEVSLTNKYNIPATVFVLEQWSDEATYYMFNDAQYALKEPGYVHQYNDMHFPEWGRWPDPKKMVQDLHDNHLKLILWQIPIQKYLNKQQHPLKDQDEQYMIDQGYVVKNPDGTPYRIPENWFTNSLIMDFTNEEAKQWWFAKRQYLLDIGVDGFKTDGGEFVFGKDLVFADGSTGSEMRNKYPNDYIEAYYQFAQENDGITFSRAGYTGAQNFPAHWAGDERSTFDAFKRSLIAGLNAGLSGVTFWGWDLAGFNGDIPTAELFMRSAAMAAFCPIMQYHAESKAEFNQDRTPWNIADRTGVSEVIDVYRFFANVRMNLMPYLYQEAKKSSTSGLPMMRALMLDYENDEKVYSIYDQYMFGDNLLVAPVIEEEEITRRVYLPEGAWTNLWTYDTIEGPTFIKVTAEIDEIPVFVKNNSAILFNVDDTKTIGSSVGNQLDYYHTPLCKIYYQYDFSQTLIDHLDNEIKLNIYENQGQVIIEVQNPVENMQFEVIGTDKDVKIIR